LAPVFSGFCFGSSRWEVCVHCTL